MWICGHFLFFWNWIVVAQLGKTTELYTLKGVNFMVCELYHNKTVIKIYFPTQKKIKLICNSTYKK